MFQARIELATLLKSCLSQLLHHVDLWLTNCSMQFRIILKSTVIQALDHQIVYTNVIYA